MGNRITKPVGALTRFSAFSFALFALSLLILSGAPSATDCNTRFDCGFRETCMNGQCMFDALSCKYDAECRPFEFCNSGTYQCQMQPGRCITGADCSVKQACNAEHYCADKAQPKVAKQVLPLMKPNVIMISKKNAITPQACRKDADCGFNRVCTGGSCADKPKAEIKQVHGVVARIFGNN
ncbi:Uncharacterised protein [uncultured archaeon]|nr:Uncharacterised protein [uncultured archaeon]